MEAFGMYLIKSVLWLTAFALVYYLFLRNERFFFTNRIFLISGLLGAFIFPLITVRYGVTIPYTVASATIDLPQPMAVQAVEEPLLTWQSALLILFALGVVWFLGRLIFQTSRILKIIRRTHIERHGLAKVIRTDLFPFSFSFFSYVFVNSSASNTEIKEIVRHEAEHIRQHHWIDLVLAELLCLLQWFNPVAWYYNHLIKQNHEYLADQKALQFASNPGVYKAVLVNQVLGGEAIRLGNSFSYSLNKKRFTMMTIRPISTLKKLKTLFILPVIGLLFYGFAQPKYNYLPVEEENTTNLVQTKGNTVKGTVVQENNQPLPGTSIVVVGTTTGAVADPRGRFQLKDIPEDSKIAFSFVGFKTVTRPADFKNQMKIVMVKDTALIGDGVHVIGYGPMKEDVTAGYPAKNREVVVGYKTPGKNPVQEINKALNSDKNPLIIVDGQEITKNELDTISPKNIESISVLKDDSATRLYGDKGKDGVIIVERKKQKRSGIVINDTGIKDGKSPLIIVDGEDAGNSALKEIDPNTIKSVNVIKDESAISKYGEKAKNGVIEITLKKEGEEVTAIHPDSLNGKQEKERPVFFIVEEMPEFPGGEDALKEFVQSELKYPVEAKEKGIQGRVYVVFIVSATGDVEGVKIAKGVHPSLDAEAMRVVRAMPQWKPGKQRGVNVAVSYTIPINFVPPKEPKKSETIIGEDKMPFSKYDKANDENTDKPVFFVVEEMPEFPGGKLEMNKFIATHIKYPAIAQENGIEGKVYVVFEVSPTGSVENVKVAKGVDPSLDAEAVRVVKAMPDWNPGQQRGKKVAVTVTVPVEFHLQ